jgi:hypothetical protein
LRLVVSPSLAGAGRRLFEETGGLQRIELVDAGRSGGCPLLHYRLSGFSTLTGVAGNA